MQGALSSLICVKFEWNQQRIRAADQRSQTHPDYPFHAGPNNNYTRTPVYFTTASFYRMTNTICQKARSYSYTGAPH